MEKGAPDKGRFSKKRGRSPLLSSLARTGFVLAVCTPVVIAPVPAAAQCGDFACPGGGRGGLGGGGRGYGGAGMAMGVAGLASGAERR